MTVAGAPSRRERLHAATVAEISEVARRLVTEQGAAALTLRAVARELGMTPSALYRYVDSRDALLTTLIVESYDDVGEVAERAAAAADQADGAAAFLAVAHAFRDWALAKPHSFGLLFGTPVPGFEPPPDTLGHALRITDVLLGILERSIRDGLVLTLVDDELGPRLHTAMHESCSPAFEALTPAATALALVCWTSLLGAIAAEVFGHLPPQSALAPRELFTLAMERYLRCMGFLVP